MTAPGKDEPTIVGAGEAVDLNLLVPGCIVYRWTVPASQGRVRVPLPCHEAQAVVADPCGGVRPLVVCRVCSTAYQLELWDELDGGYAAELTVAGQPVLLSRGHNGGSI